MATSSCLFLATIYNQSQLVERKHVARYWLINTAATAVPLSAHPSPLVITTKLAAAILGGGLFGGGVLPAQYCPCDCNIRPPDVASVVLGCFKLTRCATNVPSEMINGQFHSVKMSFDRQKSLLCFRISVSLNIITMSECWSEALGLAAHAHAQYKFGQNSSKVAVRLKFHIHTILTIIAISMLINYSAYSRERWNEIKKNEFIY